MTASAGASERERKKSVLAVDGIDGSGKSLLAARLIQATTDAGLATVALGVDDFRRPVDWTAGGRAEADVYYDDYYDLALLDRCLAAFLDGAAESPPLPIFDAAAHRLVGERQVHFGEAHLLVVEGIFALRVANVASRAFSIYLRTTFTEARRRIVERDTGRGRTLADVNHRIDARYFPAQERYLRQLQPLERVPALVDNEDWRAPRLLRFDEVAARARLTSSAVLDLPALVRRTLGAFATPATVG